MRRRAADSFGKCYGALRIAQEIPTHRDQLAAAGQVRPQLHLEKRNAIEFLLPYNGSQSVVGGNIIS